MAVIALGDFYQKGQKVVDMLAGKGINATLINPRLCQALTKKCLKV